MKTLALCAALLSFALPARAATCPDCPKAYDIAAEKGRHDLLLYGTVFAARDSTLPRSGGGLAPSIRLVSIKVMGVWKGNPSRELVLELDPCAARHADPQPGESWIVYADSVNGRPVIPACTGSALRTGKNAEYTVLGVPKSLNVPGRKKPTPH
jgi:hypothetical protein